MLLCMESLGRRYNLDLDKKPYDADTFEFILSEWENSNLRAVNCDNNTLVVEIAGGDVAAKSFSKDKDATILGKVICIAPPYDPEDARIDVNPDSEYAKRHDGISFFVGLGVLTRIDDEHYLVNEEKLLHYKEVYSVSFSDDGITKESVLTHKLHGYR